MTKRIPTIILDTRDKHTFEQLELEGVCNNHNKSFTSEVEKRRYIPEWADINRVDVLAFKFDNGEGIFNGDSNGIALLSITHYPNLLSWIDIEIHTLTDRLKTLQSKKMGYNKLYVGENMNYDAMPHKEKPFEVELTNLENSVKYVRLCKDAESAKDILYFVERVYSSMNLKELIYIFDFEKVD